MVYRARRDLSEDEPMSIGAGAAAAVVPRSATPVVRLQSPRTKNRQMLDIIPELGH